MRLDPTEHLLELHVLPSPSFDSLCVPLYVPACDARKVDKALAGSADGVILDLEDGVAPAERPVGRQVIADLRDVDRPVFVRVNGLGTADHELDLKAVNATRHVTAVVVPKATMDTVHEIDTDLPIWPLIETAAGVESLGRGANDRVGGLLLGAGDLLADLGGRWTDDEVPLLYARSRVIVAAAAAGLPAIDTPDPEYRDVALVERRARRARDLGFTGKAAIHPAQIDAIRTGFAPTREEIEWATAVCARAEHGGAWTADGEVQDAATLRRAERILGGRS